MTRITKISADERFHSQMDWLDTYHIFNFSQFYKDGRSGIGDLLVVNDDKVKGNKGFGMHPHHDMEIVTWVLSGSVEHEDSFGNKGLISAGEIQQMSAGSGVLHSEANPNDEELHLLQMWVLPDKMKVEPRYQQETIGEKTHNTLALIASGKDEAPIHLHNHAASLYAGNFTEQTTVDLPTNKIVYIYVSHGSATLDNNELGHGDSLIIESELEHFSLTANADTQLVVWSIDDHARQSSQFRY